MFKTGDRVLLEESINTIPSGCYRFVEFRDGLFTFEVGTKIRFSVTVDAVSNFRKVGAPAEFTHPNEFIPKYYSLKNNLKGKGRVSQSPYTFCYIDPSIPAAKRGENLEGI